MDAAIEVTFFGRDSLDEFLIAKQEIEGFFFVVFFFFWLLTGINYLNFIVS